jgi:hypothetical protein
VFAGPDEDGHGLFVNSSPEWVETYLASADEVVPLAEPPVFQVQGPVAVVRWKIARVRVGDEWHTAENTDILAQHEGQWQFVFGAAGDWRMTPEDDYDPDNSDHVALRRLLDRTEDAVVRKDAKALHGLVHPDIRRVFAGPDGPFVGGADYTDEMLEEWAIEKYSHTITSVKVLGPLAVTLSEIDQIADGQPDTLHGVLHFHGRTSDGWRTLAWAAWDWNDVFVVAPKGAKVEATRHRGAVPRDNIEAHSPSSPNE